MRDIYGCADVTKSNLHSLNTTLASADTRRRGHIRELANAFPPHPHNSMDIEGEEYISLYKEICQRAALSHDDRVLLCIFLGDREPRFSITKNLLGISQPKKNATITYVKNSLADVAYQQFSERFTTAKVSYARDFVSALEDVYRGEYDYVILPVESEKEGRMLSFSRMAQKYELKKTECCTVYSNTDDSETTFALFSRNTELRLSRRRVSLKLEISVDDPEKNIPALLSACGMYGAGLCDVYTGMGRGYMSLDITAADTDALCVYLLLEMPGHMIHGVYN